MLRSAASPLCNILSRHVEELGDRIVQSFHGSELMESLIPLKQSGVSSATCFPDIYSRRTHPRDIPDYRLTNAVEHRKKMSKCTS